MNIDELVKAAAEAMKMPESMVRRSAEARSKSEGRPVEAILAGWAGVDPAAQAPEPPTVPDEPAAAIEPAEAAGPAPAPAAAAADLEAKAAAAMGMSATMVKRSAAARAKAEGRSPEEVLAEWAGVELSSAPPTPAGAVETPPAPEEVAPAPAPAAPVPAPAAEPAAAAPDVGDLLAKAAAAQGLPEAMVKRSAAARAKAAGTTTEAVLAEWAGVEAPPAGAGPAATAAPASVPAAAPAPAEPVGAEVEVIAEGESPEPASLEPEPEREPELVTPAGSLPRWLAALFIAVPAFAIAYAGFLPNGPNCGDAGKLAVDPVTGIAVNCDGSAFGEDEVDFFAIGAQVFGARCAVCHGPNGAGVGNFPPFVDGALLETFPEGSCDIHIEWVTLGTTGWPETTYGANNQPVGGRGTMPTFGTQLTEQELHSVVLYERVQFGGLPLEATIAECGL